MLKKLCGWLKLQIVQIYFYIAIAEHKFSVLPISTTTAEFVTSEISWVILDNKNTLLWDKVLNLSRVVFLRVLSFHPLSFYYSSMIS